MKKIQYAIAILQLVQEASGFMFHDFLEHQEYIRIKYVQLKTGRELAKYFVIALLELTAPPIIKIL